MGGCCARRQGSPGGSFQAQDALQQSRALLILSGRKPPPGQLLRNRNRRQRSGTQVAVQDHLPGDDAEFDDSWE